MNHNTHHYIVTGGAGFIGSNLVARLEQMGHQVTVVDVVSAGDKASNLARRKLIDVVEPPMLSSYLEEIKDTPPRAIFHMGATSSTVTTDLDHLNKNNVEYSKMIWRWCSQNNIDMVYASSAATYGDGSNGFSDDEALLPYLKPLNPYGWSKHQFDLWAIEKSQHGALSAPLCPPHWYGLKFFNVFGPNEYHKGSQSSVIPHWVKQIQKTGKAALFKSNRHDIADGQQKRDFVHVDDCINHMLNLLQYNAKSGLYNSATGVARSFETLANLVYQAMECPSNIQYIPLPDQLACHYQYFTEGPMQKYESSIDQKACTETISTRVTNYVKDYLLSNHPYR
ncbi:MAG: ADP-glyceromanno-heptose 6-epimerase [Pseudomonadota bacterium]